MKLSKTQIIKAEKAFLTRIKAVLRWLFYARTEQIIIQCDIIRRGVSDINSVRNAVLDMMNKVKFEDDNNEHLYVRKDNGAWLQGVSTVSSIVPKDWLSAWGAKEAVKALGFSDYEGDTDFANEMWTKIKECTSVEDYQTLLKNAKGASARKSKEALVDGKEGHAWLENYVKATMRHTNLPEIPQGNLERPIKQFLAWEKDNVASWVLSEARVCNLDKNYAGTLDAVAILKSGQLAVVDFKFASHISEDYYLQTAGYQACFESYGIKFDQRIIIRLPKTLEKDEWNKEQKKYEKVENTIEVEVVNTPYEADRDAFYHALPLKQWINKYTK